MSHAGTAMKPISIKTHPTMLMSGTKRRKKPTHIVPARFLIRLASLQERLILSCNSTAALATWGSIVIEQYLHFSIPELMNSWQFGQGKVFSANMRHPRRSFPGHMLSAGVTVNSSRTTWRVTSALRNQAVTGSQAWPRTQTATQLQVLRENYHDSPIKKTVTPCMLCLQLPSVYKWGHGVSSLGHTP